MIGEDLAWLALDGLVYPYTKKHLSAVHAKDLLEKLSGGHLVKEEAVLMQVVDDQLVIEPDAPMTPLWIGSRQQLEEMIKNAYSFQGWTFSGQGETIDAFWVKEEEFPLWVQSWQASDRIVLRFGTKKLSRAWIDRKIAAIFRNRIPVVKNCDNIVVFAGRIGCSAAHFLSPDPCCMLKFSLNI